MISTKEGLEISGTRLELVSELICMLEIFANEGVLSFKTIRAAVICAENKTEENILTVLAALAEQAGQSYEKTHAEGFENFRQMIDSIFGRNKAN